MSRFTASAGARAVLGAALVLLAACDGATDATDDSDTDVVPPSPCEVLGLPEVAFDAEATAGTHRREMAADFAIPRADGNGTWSYAESWTGCDSVIVLPHDIAISGLNRGSWWSTSVADLVAKSPKNVVYIFIPRRSDVASTPGIIADMQANVDQALAGLSDEDAAWWKDRLIVANDRAYDIGNWATDILRSDVGSSGFGIDRFQRIRGLGSFADVTAYDPNITAGWPWEQRLSSAAHEAIYFNFEAERQARLDAVDATIIEGLDGSVIEQFEDFDLTLPDAGTMAGFDTLEFDVLMECPDPEKGEQGNCGAWDYLAHVWLYQGEGEDERRIELARFITTYHRESRWVVDASQSLAFLQDGGPIRLRYEWAPSWNTQPTGVTFKVRLSNQGKGMRPTQAIPLYTGGALNQAYNEDREPMDVDLPSGAKKVELWAIITGHGAETNLQCAEFCNHGHRFTVGGTEYFKDHPEADEQQACELDVINGTVPNQGGTWWFGRGGWCPGREVHPWISDVTADVTLGGSTTVDYEATVNGSAPNANLGNIRLSSWLVVYE